ncbi:hypothetical protein LHV56_19155 [Peribacillus frigoritolerans]|uniref:hypothetical protein n=1 Tax=Peribacillus frigoritolerans TaxID=450367 RepID=UPI002079ECBE|nr:hypothetical protein [Peribacillus frigoritolerans]USK78952.1 hypothetical protein LHV56_19155 [Peribacillus frigoritolerans]
MAKRFKNKLFLGALAAFIYQMLVKYGIAPELETYQLGADLTSYLLIGAGVYSTFEQKEPIHSVEKREGDKSW